MRSDLFDIPRSVKAAEERARAIGARTSSRRAMRAAAHIQTVLRQRARGVDLEPNEIAQVFGPQAAVDYAREMGIYPEDWAQAMVDELDEDLYDISISDVYAAYFDSPKGSSLPA